MSQNEPFVLMKTEKNVMLLFMLLIGYDLEGALFLNLTINREKF